MLSKGVVGIVCYLIALSAVSASDVIEVESRVLGDGWFEYRVSTSRPVFVDTLTLYQLAPAFTNYVTCTPPEHWTNAFYGGPWTGIAFDNSIVQPRVNETVFQVQSSSPSFRKQNFGFTTIIGLTTTDPTVLPGGVGGYVNFDALAPCAPGAADGSPSNWVARVNLAPDIEIDGLVVTNGEIHGVKFTWQYDSTMQLEGSHDMDTWTPVAQFFGWPGQTTWTTNTSLNSYGKFFRLALVSTRHMTNSTRLVTSGAMEIPVKRQEFINGQIRVGFASVPGIRYEVQHAEWSGLVRASQQVTASGAFTMVSFDLSPDQAAGAFKVWQLAE